MKKLLCLGLLLVSSVASAADSKDPTSFDYTPAIDTNCTKAHEIVVLDAITYSIDQTIMLLSKRDAIVGLLASCTTTEECAHISQSLMVTQAAAIKYLVHTSLLQTHIIACGKN